MFYGHNYGETATINPIDFDGVEGGDPVQMYSVSFFGHRRIDDFFTAEERLEPILRDLITDKEYVEFLVGRDGDFDQLVASTVKRLKKTVRDDNSALVWVLPYETADFRDFQADYEAYYDEIEICSESANGHFKAAFQTRNEIMIKRCDLVICWVDHENGGAFTAKKYAESLGKRVINLASLPDY